MTGELLSFLLFIGLMLALVGWMLRRSFRHLDEQERRDIEDLKKDPP